MFLFRTIFRHPESKPFTSTNCLVTCCFISVLFSSIVTLVLAEPARCFISCICSKVTRLNKPTPRSRGNAFNVFCFLMRKGSFYTRFRGVFEPERWILNRE